MFNVFFIFFFYQERLLLSVLPEHVAVKMRQDLGEALDSQFKKIYMSRHENVRYVYIYIPACILYNVCI